MLKDTINQPGSKPVTWQQSEQFHVDLLLVNFKKLYRAHIALDPNGYTNNVGTHCSEI
jgi:hypothetical protein